MDSRPLLVLAVASDRPLLRRISGFLEAFAFQACQAADLTQAQAALESTRPDFLLIDESLAFSGGLDLCRSLTAREHDGNLVALLLAKEPSARQLQDAIEAGFDDFLAKPLVFGELLARLRAGARALEFERRAREQAGLERLTGLLSRSSFLAALEDVLSPSSGKPRRASCVLLDLDFLDRVNTRGGRAAGDELLRSLALHLVERAGENVVIAAFGGGRFAALLPNRPLAEAAAWAESVRASLAETEFTVGTQSVRVTASFGVAEQPGQDLPSAELLVQAEAALVQAKRSGRDCVVRAGEFAAEAREFAVLSGSRRWFETTTAEDVMTPCTLVIHANEAVDHALAQLRQYRQTVAPVVDTHGKLVGLFAPDERRSGPRGSWRLSGLVKDVMHKTATSFDVSTAYTELTSCFARNAESTLVIVENDIPLGLVTRSALASFEAPISTATFAPAGGFSGDSEYLVVAG